MPGLLEQIAERERQKFFWRLDAQWGKGYKYHLMRVTPDRMPNPAKVTAPPRLVDYSVLVAGLNKKNPKQREVVFTSCYWEQCLRFAERNFPNKRVWYRGNAEPNGSKYIGCDITALVAEFKLGCQNQTVVKRAWEVQPHKTYRSTRLLGIEPSLPEPEPIAPVLSPDRPIVQKLVADAIPQRTVAAVSAQLSFDFIEHVMLRFRSSRVWPRVSFDSPIPIAPLVGVQMRLGI